MKRDSGYTIIMLLVVLTVLAVGLLVAVPVWQTQIRRESEEELIFRGKQYVEAIRLYQQKNPGQFPPSLEDLHKKRFLRRLYPDPMTGHGKWDIICQSDRMGRRQTATPGGQAGAGGLQLLIVPEASLRAIGTPRILGVVSSSTKTGLRLYNDEETYDKWFFFYGQDAKTKPEIIYFGERDKK
jgi:type II secretory pathway pseudopilin PulG